MALPNHKGIEDSMSIYQMVRDRLRFVTETEENEKSIARLTLEVMYELNQCFKLPEESIGDEAAYTVLQRSMIADIVALYIILAVAGTGSLTVSEGGEIPTGTTFLKKAVAGSVEVEYDQFKIDTATSIRLGSGGLYNYFKSSAMRKGRTLGCIFDICDDCTIDFTKMAVGGMAPFKVIGGCGCC